MRRMLHFSAAKIDRARKLRDAEFAHYVRGKEHYPYRFDLTYFSEVIAALKETITPRFYAERTAYADQEHAADPDFRHARSGTTLTEQILAAHPNVSAGGELTFFSETVAQLGLAAATLDTEPATRADLRRDFNRLTSPRRERSPQNTASSFKRGAMDEFG